MQKRSTRHFIRIFFLLALFVQCALFSFSQKNDSASVNTSPVAKEFLFKTGKTDSVFKKIYSPRKAALRSAIFPGMGQIYNRKYWKLPIIYTAMGISGGIFFYNLNNYRDTRFAYNVKYNMRVNKTDSALFVKIKEQLQPLTEESLRFYRTQFRRDIDFSAVFFLLMWGLNVVDAAVDAHLKGFDVSPNLGLQIKPGHSEIAGTNGVSLVLNIR
ncbi:MAG: DUF5683 domain-containing protein [Bacteroidota bacterium]